MQKIALVKQFLFEIDPTQREEKEYEEERKRNEERKKEKAEKEAERKKREMERRAKQLKEIERLQGQGHFLLKYLMYSWFTVKLYRRKIV